MYDYLPTDDSPLSAQFKIPTKLTLEGAINTLKLQNHCLGTYVRIDREMHGAPLFKHCTADLVLGKAKNVGEDNDEEGWAISRWATFSVQGKEQRCMQIACGHLLPLDNKSDGKWQEWNGRAWIDAASVLLRPTYHGFGLSGGDQSVHNSYTASDDPRRKSVSPAKQRGRGGRSSPPKAVAPST